MLDDLLDPSAYPHAVQSPVHHLQTHISHVFLTGRFAYKIKKPVNLGFLDYSALEQRQRSCQRDVALIRQFAPHLSSDAVPVRVASGRHTLDPDSTGEIVDYAVKMNQFREDDVLLKVFERGKLTENDVIELAHQLARTHTDATTSEAVAAYGKPEAIRAMAAENLDIVRPFIGRGISSETFDRVESLTHAFFDAHRERFTRRMKSGRIRECHGDLHLNNICRYEGHLQFFDRIEFNEKYMNIDVIYDLAFLLMDIGFRGRPDLATILLNEYMEQTGDYEGATLLPVYLSMRAFIRGEVQSLLSAEDEVEAEQRERAAAEATRYFDHALDALTRSDARLMLVGGVSGSGKSYLARRLAPALNAMHIRSDAVRKHLAGVPLTERGQRIYTEAHTDETYRALIRLAADLVSEGFPVILDATWLESSRRSQALIDGIPSAIVFCRASEDELASRIAGRHGDVSDATADVMREQLNRVEPPGDDEADVVLSVDTMKPGTLETVLAALTRPAR